MQADTNDPDAQILDEMARIHGLHRRLYRRFVCALSLASAGFASILFKRATDLEDAGDPIGIVALLSITAASVSLFDAREASALNTRMGLLSRELRSLALRHR